MNNTLTILIADSNKFISEFLRAELTKYTEFKIVDIALTVNEEIEMIDKYKPNVVITNIKKDGKISGLDIIETYKKRAYSTEFVIISGYDKLYYSSTLLELDVTYYIQKPFSYDTIIDALLEIQGARYESMEWTKCQ